MLRSLHFTLCVAQWHYLELTVPQWDTRCSFPMSTLKQLDPPLSFIYIYIHVCHFTSILK